VKQVRNPADRNVLTYRLYEKAVIRGRPERCFSEGVCFLRIETKGGGGCCWGKVLNIPDCKAWGICEVTLWVHNYFAPLYYPQISLFAYVIIACRSDTVCTMIRSN
jgi:hypothetical protein